MDIANEMKLTMDSRSINEGFSRVAVSAFIACADPNIEEITDIKTAVSEAVTNAIVHGYENKEGEVTINCEVTDNVVTLEIIDNGVGISDIEKAKTPFYTSKPELERSGMGFTVMEGFMDRMDVYSVVGEGTRVVLSKNINDFVD